jgi:hypothetical protein
MDIHPQFPWCELPTTINTTILIARLPAHLKSSSGHNMARIIDTSVIVYPSPQVQLTVATSEPEPTDVALLRDAIRWNGAVTVHFDTDDIEIKCKTVQINNQIVKLIPLSQPIMLGIDNPIASVEIALTNIPLFSGATQTPFESMNALNQPVVRSLGSVTITAENWATTITEISSTSTVVEQLKEHGGFGITHTASISKLDRTTINQAEATAHLYTLRQFFTFVLGRKCSEVIAYGIDQNGLNQWQIVGGGQIDPWDDQNGWFCEQQVSSLAAIFPGFFKLWQDESWSSAIKMAIYWRAEGNSINTDGGLILIQAALEKVAWTYLSHLDNPPTKRKKFAIVLRELLDSLNIPTAIPNELADLYQLGSTLNQDGPNILATHRNELIHPDPSKDLKGEKPQYYEAWVLASWYLEVALLNLFGYNGNYRNRVTARFRGQVELVPWASDQ